MYPGDGIIQIINLFQWLINEMNGRGGVIFSMQIIVAINVLSGTIDLTYEEFTLNRCIMKNETGNFV